jgi:hypothetical protein
MKAYLEVDDEDDDDITQRNIVLPVSNLSLHTD